MIRAILIATLLVVTRAQLIVTQPTAEHWCESPLRMPSHFLPRRTAMTRESTEELINEGVGGGLNTLAWTGTMPPDFQVFLVNPDKNVLVGSMSHHPPC